MIGKKTLIVILVLSQILLIAHPFSSPSVKALVNSPHNSVTENNRLVINQAVSITGPLKVSNVNRRYFADPSGKIVYLTGSHTWCNLMDCDDANPIIATFNYTAFLNFLVSHNHNFFRLWRAENARGGEAGPNFWFSPMPYQRSTTCCAFDGGNKFELTKFNQAYFDRMRSRIIAARDRGIYVSIMLFDGWSVESKISNHNPWDGHPYKDTNNINNIDGDVNNDNQAGETHTLANTQITALQEVYIRKVIDSVNDLDNVLYEISNESPSNSEAWQYHMINYIKSYEATKPKQHPVGMTWEYPGGNNNDLYNSPADWISLGGNAININTYDPPVATGSKVILADTDHLCGICGNRQWVWKSFTRGENPIFMDVYDPATTSRGKYLTPTGNEADIRANLGFTRNYANRMNLAVMTPQPSLCSTGYCLANTTTLAAEYLAYLPSGGSININLSAASGTFKVEWFNPATGATVTGNVVIGGATKTLTAPFSGDAVLYIFPPSPTALANSVLPTNRSIQVGTTATIFNTVLNGGNETAYGVILFMDPQPAGTFSYQESNCGTNALIGGMNPILDIPPGQARCYVLSFVPSAPFAATDVYIRAQGNNTPATPLFLGINTWMLRATSSPGPDMIALTTTTDFHQVSCKGTKPFAVAFSNVGAATSQATVTADTGSASLSLSILIQETDPATGVVIGDNVLENVGAGEIRSVVVWVTFNKCISFNPAANRIFIRVRDGSSNIIGSTGTAVSTNR